MQCSSAGSVFVEMVIEGDYERDGAVCIRRAFSEDHLALARDAIEANLANPSSLAQRASPIDDGAFVEDFCNWSRIPQMERFIRESPAAAIAGMLTNSNTIRLYHDHLLVKEPGTKQRTPWHQDQPYYNVEGTQNTSMWFPVDPVDRSSTLEFIAGTHRGPWMMPRTFLAAEAKWFPEGSLVEAPDYAADPERWPVIGWELEPGDAVFFNMLTVHGSGGVSGPNRRRVLSVRFLGDDMVHAPRRWKTSPPFEGLEAELPAGVPMDHPLFPVLWTH
jgi:ectoine hydroxylase-related dioxygenase (phytanoyl-CoA dioxygenase family)